MFHLFIRQCCNLIHYGTNTLCKLNIIGNVYKLLKNTSFTVLQRLLAKRFKIQFTNRKVKTGLELSIGSVTVS